MASGLGGTSSSYEQVGGVGSFTVTGHGFAEADEVEIKRRDEEYGSDRTSTGNRWPRQETLALLKIRSDMDVSFRDSTLKGPLWEEVSRRLADLGYQRNAKKCREKFENVYKYHKRTKEGRASKHDGNKTYRFFNQLEALETNQLTSLPSTTQAKGIQSTAPATAATTTVAAVTNPTSISPAQISTQPSSIQVHGTELMSTSTSSSFDEESKGSRKKKRKLTAFFENLMKEVNEKQEMLENKFMEAIKKHENQLLAREEEWKKQELAILNREHEITVQERNLKAAKDAAVIAFLQDISQKQNTIVPSLQIQEKSKPVRELEKIVDKPRTEKIVDRPRTDNVNENYTSRSLSSSRWPKEEIEALIKIRTNLEIKYQESMPKGPLWEEISCAMKKLGYNRSAKRCKEKWENINKYFKKVKESNKRRPEDSKTCPYFEQLEELYREKNDKRRIINNTGNVSSKDACELKPEELVMHMMMHKPATEHKQESGPVMDDHIGLENDTDKNQEEEDEGGGYEIIHRSSMEIAG